MWSPPAFLQIACLALFAILLMAAAVQDLRTMRIANEFPIAIINLFAVAAWTELASNQLSFSAFGMSVACGVAVFAVGTLAFASGMLGGGDVKMLAAVSLFAGPARLLDFLAIVALAGGVTAIAILAGAPIGQPAATGGRSFRARLRSGMPYGPAIALGGLWVAGTLGLS